MATHSDDDAARRAYWAEQMQLGFELVNQVLEIEVRECGEPFASIPDAAKARKAEMLFADSKIAGDLDRLFFMRESLVTAVVDVGREMNARGWILKIEDGYRTLDMQAQLGRKPEVFDAILKKCIWENGGKIPPVELMYRRAAVLIANVPKAEIRSGSRVCLAT